MIDVKQLDVQYLTDGAGRRTGVVLPVEQFDQLLEDIDDLAAVAERRDEQVIPHERVVEDLRRDGLLD